MPYSIEIFKYYLILLNKMNKYKIIRKIRKSGTSLAVNIPKEVTEFLNIKEGDLVEVVIGKIK